MAKSNYYGGAIWTNHVLERMKQRGITQDLVLEAFQRPDNYFPGRQPGTTEYKKKMNSSIVTVIAKQNERSEWLLLSAWIDPPIPGTEDAKRREQWRKYKKASVWGKIWLEVLRQLGIKKF